MDTKPILGTLGMRALGIHPGWNANPSHETMHTHIHIHTLIYTLGQFIVVDPPTDICLGGNSDKRIAIIMNKKTVPQKSS